MIPTSPIAFLLKDMLKPWVKPENINSILDLCTGSAALSIIATKVFNPNLSEAVDICENALTVARDNISKHDVNINLIQSDLFNNVVNKYDLIISNPPYVSKTSYDRLPHEFTFEPKKAFISDNKGLDIPLRIICESINFLNDDGVLLLEVGESDYLLESYINQPILWLDTGNSACGVCLFNKKELIRIEKKIRLNNKGI
jgi:ribosomal protein L3 glutamine methyltransferase